MFDVEVVTRVIEGCRAAAAVDVSSCIDEELLAAVPALERARRALDAAEAHVVAELDERAVCERSLGHSTKTWLASVAGLPAAAAGVRVEVARGLRRRFPSVDRALADGKIGWEHARVIVKAANPRIADDLAAVQDHLIASTVGTVFGRWQREVRSVAETVDQEGGYDPARDLEANVLHYRAPMGGLSGLEATFTDDHGPAVFQAIEAKADELYRRFRRDHDLCDELPIPTRATLRALALVELVREGQGVDLHATRAPRVEVTLIAQASDPVALSDPDGVRLSDGTCRRICCDPDLLPIVVDQLGVPLDAGRTTRRPTRTQRRAAEVRDGGCVFPDCPHPISWTELHHIIPWQHGGPTDLANLASLCRHHHGVTHRHGWAMQVTEDQWFSWTTPNGATLHSQRHHRRRDGPTPLAA